MQKSYLSACRGLQEEELLFQSPFLVSQFLWGSEEVTAIALLTLYQLGVQNRLFRNAPEAAAGGESRAQ